MKQILTFLHLPRRLVMLSSIFSFKMALGRFYHANPLRLFEFLLKFDCVKSTAYFIRGF